jgi:hypothetical protein
VRGEGGERFLDLGERIETEEAFAARAQFADGLRAAQHQHAEQCDLGGREEDGVGEGVLVFRDAAFRAVVNRREPLGAQAIEGAGNLAVVERRDRVAVGELVAGVGEGVERERIILGRREGFFDEGAEDADFGGGKRRRGIHGVAERSTSNV